MRTPLALYNLMHGKWRTVISTSGVAVAIILVFMQLGFLSAVIASANLIYDNLAFDVLLRSPDYYHFCDPREFPRSYLYQLESLPEVESVKPLLRHAGHLADPGQRADRIAGDARPAAWHLGDGHRSHRERV